MIISVSRESGNLNPDIVLFDPDGNPEASNSCGESGGCVHTEINHQLLQSGLYTIVVMDNGGNETGNYSLSLTKIPGGQTSPAIRIILNQSEFQIGETLIVSAHVTNGPNPVDVEVKAWVDLPNGEEMELLEPDTIFIFSNGVELPLVDFRFTVKSFADFTVELLTHTFSGSEPSGVYNVGSRLLNPISGRTISVNVESFSF